MSAVENKTPDNSNLVKGKTDYNLKISEIEKKVAYNNDDKNIDTPQFNNFTADIFAARLAQANLITKTDFDIKLTSFNKKNNSNKTKHLLVENEFERLETFDSSYFRGKSYIENDGAQNYLVF